MASIFLALDLGLRPRNLFALRLGVCCDFQFMFLENIDYFRFGGLRRGSTFVLQYAKAIVSMETDVVGT